MIFYISEDIESIVEERQKGENPLRRAFLEIFRYKMSMINNERTPQ